MLAQQIKINATICTHYFELLQLLN